MVDQPVPACSGAPFDLAARFIGVWQEFTVKDGEEILEGTLTTQFDLGGCVLIQRFSSANGAFAFISFGYVEPEANSWFETYIFNNGRSTQWRWHDKGEEVIMEQVNTDKKGGRRLRVVNQRDDTYEVIEERQTNQSKGWEYVELTRTRRIK